MPELFRPTAQLKISLTPDCNNDCPICLNKTTRSRNAKKNGRLSKDMIRRLIDEASDMGMIGVYWTGGEPLIEYRNLLELSRCSSKRGLIPTIVTNGGLIGAYGNYKKLNQPLLERAGLYHLDTRQIVESLKEAGIKRVYFSVDSSHTTLESVYSNVYNIVPAEAVSQGIRGFMEEDYGKIHSLEAIGHQLRVTSTSSGPLKKPTNIIVSEVMGKAGLKLKKELSAKARVFGNEKGEILLKQLNVASLGDAKTLDHDILENRAGQNLFGIGCPHFLPREKAFDAGKHHGDLFIHHDGTLYTCGNHAYPVGNVFEESLPSIIRGINKPDSRGDFSLTRKVYHSLLTLSRQGDIGDKALGEAFRLIYASYPKLLNNIKTQCGACSCLGHQKDLQEAFLNVFKKHYSLS